METILKIMVGINLFGFLYRLKINIPKIYFYINYEKVIIIIPIIVILFVIYLIIDTTNNISFIKNELSEIRQILIEINKKELSEIRQILIEINEKELSEKEIIITKEKRKKKF